MMDFDSILMEQGNEAMESSRMERKEGGKRGRKPGRKAADKVDLKAKLERSRQSARECRARKKLRYQYLEELVSDREKAILVLRKELDKNIIEENEWRLNGDHLMAALLASKKRHIRC